MPVTLAEGPRAATVLVVDDNLQNREVAEGHLVGAGYAVVYCNPRGSSGYTEEWGRAIRGGSNGQGPGWGTVDHQDVLALLRAKTRNNTNPRGAIWMVPVRAK